MADALANAGADVTDPESGFGSQAFTGTGTPGTGGTTISAYAWTLVGKPPGSSAALTGASTATVTLVPDIVGNYRLFLVVTDDVGNVSESDPYQAPDAAFTQYRVELTNTGLQKLAPGERNYTEPGPHAVVDYLEDTVAPKIAPATTSAIGIVKLKDAPVDAANPKAITQDRITYTTLVAGKIEQEPGSGNPCRAIAWWMIPEDLMLFSASFAFGDGGTTTRVDYVINVYKQSEADWVGNVYGVSLGTATITAPGTNNVPRGTNLTLTSTACSARDVVSVVITSADADSADQGSDLSISLHLKRVA